MKNKLRAFSVPNAKHGFKWGFKNKEGKIVIKPRFESTYDFSKGLCRVKIRNRWGFIDESGKLVIKNLYIKAFNFRGNKAFVQFDPKSPSTYDWRYQDWGYIDKRGVTIERRSVPYHIY